MFVGVTACSILAVGVLVMVGASRLRDDPPTNPPNDLAGLPDGGIPLGPGEPVPQIDPLATRVLELFKENCYRCHGEDGTDEGDFNFLLERDRLIAGKLVVPGKPDESKLFQYVDKGSMPADDDPLAREDVDALRAWIEQGAPNFSNPLVRDLFANAQMVKTIREDLEAVSARDRPFTRYFTLTNLFNAGFSDEELTTYRLALSKLVNSLSWQPQLKAPQAVDDAGTVLRIDLRDYDWDAEVWSQIVKANPYSVVWNTPDSQRCSELTDCEVPDVRADWFVHAASRPPLYHQVLQLPDTLNKLLEERLLAIDIEKNVRQDRAVRAGFARSGVSAHNRLLERHDSPYGYLWISYDFAADTGRKNIFQSPLGPGTEENRFDHDGGEIIFSLPNGLQGYLLVDATGKRIDKAPTQIVTDPRASGSVVTNGISCMSCHYGGIIPKADEIRPHVQTNIAAFSDSADILALYAPTEKLNALYRDDAARFEAKVRELGIERVTQTGEPVVNMAQRFETELDLKVAAAEMGLQPDDLTSRLSKSAELARVLGPLSAGGLVKRDVFIQSFVKAVEAFGLGTGVNDAATQVADNANPAGTTPPAAAATAPATATAGTPAPDPAATPNPAGASAPANPATPPTPAGGATAAAPANNGSGTQQPVVRTWKDISGNEITAAFVEFSDGQVRVQMDGRVFQVPLERLSEADQQFVLAQAPPAAPADAPPGEAGGAPTAAPPPAGGAQAPKPAAIAGQPPVGANPPAVRPAGTRPPAGRPPPPAPPVIDFRRWYNEQIDKVVVARFQSLNNGDLRLEQKLGRDLVKIRWPMIHLCPADRQYVEQLLGKEEYLRHRDIPGDPFGKPF